MSIMPKTIGLPGMPFGGMHRMHCAGTANLVDLLYVFYSPSL
jgi:hypothetical protein